MAKIKISGKELDIMEILWNSDRALSVKEMEDLLEKKFTRLNFFINELLEKKLVEISGFEQVGKHYIRKFKASISPEDYMVSQFRQSFSYKNSSRPVSEFVSTLLETEDEDTAEDLIRELEEMLKER